METADVYQTQLNSVDEALSITTDAEQRKQLEVLRENIAELLELIQQTPPENENGVNNDNDAVKDEADVDIRMEVDQLREHLQAMIGQKCSAPHKHSWGSVDYHNAIVCGIEDKLEIDMEDGSCDIYVRVLFTNPTHKEMVPCNYYLEGDCRFDAERCHYSHGELIAPAELKEYHAPNFELLQRNCVVLAKMKDRIWHRGRVLQVNGDNKTCTVRMDGKHHKAREQDFEFEDLMPIFHDDDLSSGSSSDSDSETETEELDDFELARRVHLIEQSLFNEPASHALGDWEKHTRGIGSKLMAKMGYIHGCGLGSDGRGIVTPISAQILPQGCSLDHCMQLREAANGDKNLFSVEKKLKQQQHKQEKINAKAYERESRRVDVFSFLNDSILASCSAPSKTAAKPEEHKKKATTTTKNLSDESTKSLNVQSVRIADDIKCKEREIAKVQEALKRNASTSGSELHKRLQAQFSAKSLELDKLRAEERNLTKEQTTRKTKDKLYVF